MAKVDIYQLKVTLIGTDPVIWRRIQVPARLNLKNLHNIVQCVMGWRDLHLHQFEIAGKRYSDPIFEIDVYDEEGDEPTLDTARVKLSEIAGKTESFQYQYDFGDDWRHEIQIEKSLTADYRVQYPVCVGGKRACPPEDCGGTSGYENFLQELANPDDPEHDSSLQWVGGFFDPATFDPNHINREHLWRKKW